jgi:hypothetical protein
MISYYTKVHLSKCNGSWVVSTKQNMNFNIQMAAMFVFFCFWQKWYHLKLFILWRSISIHNFMVPRWLVQVLHPPQKFERLPFWSAWRYEIKKYGVEVTFNGMTSLLNFIKIYQLVQKLLGGGATDGQTDRQTGDLISLTFLFEETRLKMAQVSSHAEKFPWDTIIKIEPRVWRQLFFQCHTSVECKRLSIFLEPARDWPAEIDTWYKIYSCFYVIPLSS